MAEFFVPNRTNTAQAFTSFEKCYKRGKYEVIEATTPAAGAAIPQTGGAAVQEYASADVFATDMVCSGTLLKIGDLYGVLMTDAPVSTSAPYAYKGIFQLRLTAGVSPSVGADAYIVDATGLLHDTAAGGRTWVGKFVSTATTDPLGQPAGDYALVDFGFEEV